MFANFTDRARRVIATAQNEAVRLHHRYIGTEDILLGLCDDSHGLAVTALRSLFPATAANPTDTDNTALYAAVRKEIEKAAASGKEDSAPKPLPFTAAGKIALEHAMRIAAECGHPYVGTEHLLLGLLCDKDEDNCALAVLINLGFSPGAIKAQVMEYLGLAGDGGPISKDPNMEAPRDLPKKPMQYQIVGGDYCRTPAELAIMVTDLLNDGWELLGPPTISPYTHSMVQPMIKKS